MTGLVLLLAVLAIAGVVIWSIMNDEVPMGGATRWLFAMRDQPPAATDGPNGESAPPAAGAARRSNAGPGARGPTDANSPQRGTFGPRNPS